MRTHLTLVIKKCEVLIEEEDTVSSGELSETRRQAKRYFTCYPLKGARQYLTLRHDYPFYSRSEWTDNDRLTREGLRESFGKKNRTSKLFWYRAGVWMSRRKSIFLIDLYPRWEDTILAGMKACVATRQTDDIPERRKGTERTGKMNTSNTLTFTGIVVALTL